MTAETSAPTRGRNWEPSIEPLSRMSDLTEYRAGFEKYMSGAWDDERWTTFRLRFGVYGQSQPGVQMMRIKLPGGIASTQWERTIARLNREISPGADVHITTRQDCQVYSVPLERTPAFLEKLYAAGLTTREACGNTLRNMTSCHLAGVCPRERVDAGEVASRLTRSWLRNPLVQNMPRKFKVSVSGCETDCAASGIHDLGLIASKNDGRNGFIVYGCGSTGGQPMSAVKLADFAAEEEIPAVLEALVRLHQRYSNRTNLNAARIKFVVKRFGEEKFRALFAEEFARTRRLPQRPWTPLKWREPEDAPAPASPGGVVRQHDGRIAVVMCPFLGLLSSDRLDALADIAERHGAAGFRTTREQNLVITGLPAAAGDAVAAEVRALGLEVEEKAGGVGDLVVCPGTTTCRLGITNSQKFAHEIAKTVRNYAAKPDLSIRISGCQNGCGLHHVGDFGFRGMGKKIDGKNAPHYQIYVGGNSRQVGALGLPGPIVPALYAPEALNILMQGYGETRDQGESLREWASRLGNEGLRELLSPVLDRGGEQRIYVDWGEDKKYSLPKIVRGECAAPFVVDNLLKDMADDSLSGFDRAILSKLPQEGRRFGREGIYYAARRLLIRLGDAGEETPHDVVLSRVRASYAGEEAVIKALHDVLEAEKASSGNGDIDNFREALAAWIEIAAEMADTPLVVRVTETGRLDDSSGFVIDMIRGQGGVK